jgi:hypothetical protein
MHGDHEDQENRPGMSDLSACGGDESEPARLPIGQVSSLTSGWQPVAPASSRWERAADRYLAGWEAVAGGYRVLGLIVAVSLLGWLLPGSLVMLPWGMFVVAVGLGCAVGFLRCRTAHCAIAGVGLTLVGVLIVMQAGLGASWLGFYVWLAVAWAIILVGFAFQAAWSRTHNSTRVLWRARS